MTHQSLRDLLLSMPLSTCDFPFGTETEVFRIHNKIFAVCAGNQVKSVHVNLKCDPDLAADLRQTWPEITPGWHMNKRHWNTVSVSGGLPEEQVAWLVRHSYECVLASLPKRKRVG